MRATEPSYSDAIDAAVRYRERRKATLSVEERETVDEIIGRLYRLEENGKTLIKMNNRFLEQGLAIEFDSTTDTLTARFGDISSSLILNRADPNVPIQIKMLGAAGAYKAGSGVDIPPGVGEVEKRTYEELLEGYYYNAHRIITLMKQLPGQGNFTSTRINVVRNNLVEHADKGAPYSFGYSPQGPIVRPAHHPGRKWQDKGLVLNTKQFVTRLADALNRD